ncbi:S9 family peptidase [Gaoshiqia sp. Z1-71]|uniref:S9 family peptidase n=1 Tax=Gaoshiqia hydrogeniformans TaxID=3290090 RepID=UPI003BF82AD7
MNIAKILFLFWLVNFTFCGAAQTKKVLSLEDAIVGSGSYLKPDAPKSLNWRNDDHYVLITNDTLFQYAVSTESREALLSLAEVQNAVSNIDGLSLSAFPPFEFISNDHILIVVANRIIVLSIAEKKIYRQLVIPDRAENPDLFDAKPALAFTRGQNLFVADESGEKQITFDDTPGILNGQEVHRREFGIEKGTFWSNTGKYLAFYRKDEGMVKDYPLVDYMTRQAEHRPVKYPMAGMKSHQVRVGIYHTQTGRTIYLNTGEPDEHYLTNISWGPNDKHIYLAELNREQNHMQLNEYDAETGEKVKTLFEETSSTYVEPLHPIRFLKSKPDQFYYRSRKDGWSHLYLYDTSGKQIRQLTKGKWEVTGFYGADDKDRYAYFQATKESPVDRHLYRLDTERGTMQILDQERGVHEALFSPGKTHLIDRWSAFDVPSKTDLLRADGKRIRTVHEAKDPLADYELGENKLFTITAADDSTDLYCRMILPPNFDANRKYPVIFYVYGGPHAQLVNNNWLNDARWWQYYMASKGYIAFTADNRGSANRGGAFEEVIHRRLGLHETADQMKGVDYLKSLPYVDPDRIGVYGWSYGGFMTLNLMLRHPEVFKVGVAGGPVVDWSLYEIMYGERYMDMPGENPEGYRDANMLNRVSQLKGKLMLIHGMQDDVVVTQHSMKFLNECIRQNKPVDFFVYPTHPHNVRGFDRVHLKTKISQYFIDFL